MFGLSPWLARVLNGRFRTDLSPIKANEFFVSEAYNGLVESMYLMMRDANSFHAVFNPSTPEVSARIMTDNPAASEDPGHQHALGNTYFRFEDNFDDVTDEGYVRVTHVKRGSEDLENSPMRVMYGPGDLSLLKPYIFTAVDLTATQEQYFVAEYIYRSAYGVRRLSSVIELVLEYTPEESKASVMEILRGDSIQEYTAEDGEVSFPVKFRFRFGRDITVGDLVSALNSYTYEGEHVFEAGLKYVPGTPMTDKPLIDLYKFYSDDSPPELLTSTKVLRFIPPVPSVRAASPNTFLDMCFNVTIPNETGNIAAYILKDGHKVFKNTGTYGFILRKQYDDTGMLSLPSEFTLDTIDGDPLLMYVPNKIKAQHYTKSGTSRPDWFSTLNPVINGFFSSVDADMNYFFLPFVTVTDTTLRFASGFSIHIDKIGESTIADVSSPGSYAYDLKESLVQYDVSTDTSPYFTGMNRLFEAFKGFLGYAAVDILNDEESALLRTAEYSLGVSWYFNNVVWVDPALGTGENRPELKVYRNLQVALNAGVIKPGTVVMHMAGSDPCPADSVTDGRRHDFERNPFPAGMPFGVRHVIVVPDTVNKHPGDFGFSIQSATLGKKVFEFSPTNTSEEARSIIGQDMTAALYTGFRVVGASALNTAHPMLLSMNKFGVLQIEAYSETSTEAGYIWQTSLQIASDNIINEFLHMGEILEDAFVTVDGTPEGPTLWADTLNVLRPTVLEIMLGSETQTSFKGHLGYADLQSSVREQGFDQDTYPSALGVFLDPSFVENVNAGVSSLRIKSARSSSEKSRITYVPVVQPFQSSLISSSVSYLGDKEYDRKITNIIEAHPVNIDLNFVFTLTILGGVHEGEKRDRSLISALINVSGVISDSEVNIGILDPEIYWTPPGEESPIAWHTFDPDGFLYSEATSFPDNFMFIDCGLHKQTEFVPLGGVGGPSYGKFVSHRGGRFVNTDMTITMHQNCAVNANGEVRFFASRLFRRAAYLLYMADQHPAFSTSTRRMSDRLKVDFILPYKVLKDMPIAGEDIDTGVPAPLLVIGEWNFTTGASVTAYPRLPLVNTLPGAYALLQKNTFNWAATKTFMAGVSEGEVNIPALRYHPVQLVTVPGALPLYWNSSLNIFEDIPQTRANIMLLDTSYPLGHDYDAARVSIDDPQRGFNLTSVSFIQFPHLNLGTSIKVSNWINRAPVSGIVGGRKMNIDINYDFYTQGFEVGNLYNDGTDNHFPVKPWFHLCGVMDSTVELNCSAFAGESGNVWPLGVTDYGAVLGRLDGMRAALTTPAFQSSGTTTARRPMRFVIGLVMQHYHDTELTHVDMAGSSSGNKGYVVATRANLVLGGQNNFRGFVYAFREILYGPPPEDPEEDPPIIGNRWPVTELSPDVSVTGDPADPHTLVLNFLPIITTNRPGHFRGNIVIPDGTASTSLWGMYDPMSEGAVHIRHNVMLSGYNPCNFNVIPIDADTGALADVWYNRLPEM